MPLRCLARYGSRSAPGVRRRRRHTRRSASSSSGKDESFPVVASTKLVVQQLWPSLAMSGRTDCDQVTLCACRKGGVKP